MTFPGLVRANNLSDVVDREKAWDSLGNGITANDIPDPYYGNVSLLLHGDGANNSTTITDSSLSVKAVTPIGNARISAGQSKFGGTSLFFDGNSDGAIITTGLSDFAMSSNTYTLEAWIYPTITTAFRPIITINAANVSNFGVIYIALSGASLAWGTRHDTGSSPVDLTGGTVLINNWHHVALSVSNGSARAYLNGVQVGTTAAFMAPIFTIVGVGVGANGNQYDLASSSFGGYIDDCRVTKNVARYTANFTPPITPFYDPFNGETANTVVTIKGRDILALEGVRNTSTRDFVFIKGLTSTAQPRITTAANNTASGVARRDLAMPKLAPTTSGNYFFSSGLTLSGISTRINGTSALSIATSPFSGSTATAPLLFRELRPQANWRITEPMPSGTIATPELAIPFETSDFVLYMKAGQN